MSDEIRQLIKQLNRRMAQLYQEGQYARAIEVAAYAYNMGRQHLEQEEPILITSLNNLALSYKATGKYAMAEPLYEQALKIKRTTLGEKHPDVAQSLNNLAGLYRAMGNYAAAEPLLEEALAIRRTALGEQHSSFATSLNNLATFYYAQGNYAKATQLLEQATEIYRTQRGEEHPSFLTSLNNLAMLYKATGDYQAAEALLLQVLEILRQLFDEKHPDVAEALSNLAWLYHAIGNHTEAELLYLRALDVRREVLGEEHPKVAVTLNNLGNLYQTLGRYTYAESLYQQALQICRTTSGETHPDVAQSLNNLAALYETVGDYTQAELYYRQAFDIQRTTLGNVHPDLAASLNNLAGLYETVGNYAKADSYYRQALSIMRTTWGERHPDVAQSLNNLALLYKGLGDYTAAEPLLHQALEIRREVYGSTHPDVAASLNNLARLHEAQRNHAAAKPLYQQAIDIWRTTLGERHPKVVTGLNNLANLYYMTGHYVTAEQLFQLVLEIRRDLYEERHADVAVSLNNLAALHWIQGNYAAAEPLYQQALEITNQTLGEEHPGFVNTLNNLMALYVATGREVEAMPFFKQAETINDRMIGQIFGIGSERQRLAHLRTHRANFDVFLSLVASYLSDFPEAVQAGLSMVLRRKAIAAEALATQRDAMLSGRYPALQPKLRSLISLRFSITQKSLAGPSQEGLKVHQQRLAEWNTQKERLEADLARQIPEMNLEHKLRTADQQTIAKALPAGSALVEFVRFRVFDFKAVPARGDPRVKSIRYLAFLLFAGKPEGVQLINLGEANPIEQMITTFRRSITGENENRESRFGRPFESEQDISLSDGTALRAALFDPLLPALGGRTRLFLAPDGDLNRLPFEVLPTDNGRLIDEYQISYLGVGRDALRFAAKSTLKPTAPLVVADPDFDLGGNGATSHVAVDEPRGRQSRELDRGAINFKRLAGTRLEGEQVAAMLGVEPTFSADALESAVKACRSPRILHIATHGFFLPDQKRDPNVENVTLPTESVAWERLSGAGLENPLLRSGLALAGANTWLKGETLPAEAEDGILTAEDVSGLDLLATELVVLSACQTGLGEVQVGEGVFGLRRVFMLAGAKTLVMSLWKVPDKQTQELMSDFYRRILAGEPRVEALRQAQLAMKKKYPDPYYWGAFICQGDPSPLSKYNLATTSNDHS